MITTTLDNITGTRLWDYDDEIREVINAIEGDFPVWLKKNVTGTDVASILQGGVAGGAYLPAVIYWQANETMGEHGDAVLDYIEAYEGEVPAPPDGSSWQGMACFYLSVAVELWAAQTATQWEAAGGVVD